MKKELKPFIVSYAVSYELEAANIIDAVKLAKIHCISIPYSKTNASVVDESTGEEVFF